MNFCQLASQLRVAFRLLQEPLTEISCLLQHFPAVAVRKGKIGQPIRRGPNHVAHQLPRELQVLLGLIALGIGTVPLGHRHPSLVLGASKTESHQRKTDHERC